MQPVQRFRAWIRADRVAVLIALAMFGVLAILDVRLLELHDAEDRALRALPIQTRAEVFRNEQSEFRLTCSVPASDATRDYCEGLARRLRLFPECAEGCRAETAPFVRFIPK